MNHVPADQGEVFRKSLFVGGEGKAVNQALAGMAKLRFEGSATYDLFSRYLSTLSYERIHELKYEIAQLLLSCLAGANKEFLSSDCAQLLCRWEK